MRGGARRARLVAPTRAVGAAAANGAANDDEPSPAARSPTATAPGPDAPSDTSFAYHTDHQGSVRAITDASGAVVSRYAYGAYGNAEEAVEGVEQPYRYTGREYDSDTGLHHYRARAYDAET